MKDYERTIQVETILDLSDGLLTMTKDIMEVHGPDPNADAIIAAAYSMAIKKLSQVSESIPKVIGLMVTEHVQNKSI